MIECVGKRWSDHHDMVEFVGWLILFQYVEKSVHPLLIDQCISADPLFY